MKKVDHYKRALGSLDEWEPYLLDQSRLPGPRANIELARAVADEGSEELFEHLLGFVAATAPTNSPHEFLAFCGVLGLGRMLAEGRSDLLPRLRLFASDPRWRIREAVAMALQRLGAESMDSLLDEMENWSQGSDLERRAAAAALCEPTQLRRDEHARRALEVLDRITGDLQKAEGRASDGFRALRKGLGYCWSVAVEASPELGKPMMERWLLSEDADVRWVMKENLRKKRLLRTDAEWVASWQARLGIS